MSLFVSDLCSSCFFKKKKKRMEAYSVLPTAAIQANGNQHHSKCFVPKIKIDGIFKHLSLGNLPPLYESLAALIAPGSHCWTGQRLLCAELKTLK